MSESNQEIKCANCRNFQCDGLFAACAIKKREDGNRSPEDSCNRFDRKNIKKKKFRKGA